VLVLLVTGVAGSGTSTVARKLSDWGSGHLVSAGGWAGCSGPCSWSSYGCGGQQRERGWRWRRRSAGAPRV